MDDYSKIAQNKLDEMTEEAYGIIQAAERRLIQIARRRDCEHHWVRGDMNHNGTEIHCDVCFLYIGRV